MCSNTRVPTLFLSNFNEFRKESHLKAFAAYTSLDAYAAITTVAASLN